MRQAWVALGVAFAVALGATGGASADVVTGGGQVSLGGSTGACGSVGPAGAYESTEYFATRPEWDGHPDQVKLVRFDIQNDCNGYLAMNHNLKDGSVIWILVDPRTTASIGKTPLKRYGLYHIGDYGNGDSCCGSSPASFPLVTFNFEILPDGQMVRYTP